MRWFQLKRVWLVAFLIWLALVASGYAWLLRYSFAPGPAATVPHLIPPGLAWPEPTTRAGLFLTLHPRCPCSRATVRELAKILSRAPHLSDVTVLMYKPAKEADSWPDGDLLEECRRMNCRILPDADGRLAASLGVSRQAVSCFTMRRGKLRFRGGITSARGHEGDNAGERAIIEILRGYPHSYNSLPVFGCSLHPEPTQP